MRAGVVAAVLVAAGVARADTSPPAAAATAAGAIRFVYGDGDRELFASDSSVAVSRARHALDVYSSNWTDAADNEAGGALEVLSLDTLRALPPHFQLGPYLDEATRARRYEAVNHRLARDGFVLPTDYETASGDEPSDDGETGPEPTVVRFPRARLTVGESGRVYRDGRVVSIGDNYGELLLGAVRWWGVYLPHEGVVVVWSDRQTHDGGAATLVRRVRLRR